MFHNVIVDTGVLIALIDRRDHYHPWVTEQLKQIAPPLLTCEAVISETWFLLKRVKNGRQALLQLLENGQVKIQFDSSMELSAMVALLTRYQSVPVSVADAALIRMAELEQSSSIFTLDSDFQIYRKNRDQLISLIFPPSSI